MHVVFRERPRDAEVSIVLADWSVRESFHSIHYLNRQTVPRERYELLWIEYYGRRPPELSQELERSRSAGDVPAIDGWITLDVPEDSYYHKHLIYNAGLLAASGRIVVFCDSDAIFRPTFVEAIIDAFAREPKLVLHMDEVRGADRSHYPFDYPSIEAIETGPCINLVEGRPAGIPGPDGRPVEDQLHVANYGACMAARRSDLVAIGGADEHLDYLGHICGPYEMTFRLRNHGCVERWHESEWLYHVWHPGQAGAANYLGPHDGRHMSTTALACLESGRVLPLVENPGVRALREFRAGAVAWLPPLAQAIPVGDVNHWRLDQLGGEAEAPSRTRPASLSRGLASARSGLRILLGYSRLARRRGAARLHLFSAPPAGAGRLRRLRTIAGTARSALRDIRERRQFWERRAGEVAGALRGGPFQVVSVFGTRELAPAVAEDLDRAGLEVRKVLDERSADEDVRSLSLFAAPVVVPVLRGELQWLRELQRLGVDARRIWGADWEPGLWDDAPPPGEGPRMSVVMGPGLPPAEAETLGQRLLDAAEKPGEIEILASPEGVAAGGGSVLRACPRLRSNGPAERIATGAWIARGQVVVLLLEPVAPRVRGWDQAVLACLAGQGESPALVRLGVSRDDPGRAAIVALERRVLEEAPLILPSFYQERNVDRHLEAIFRRAAQAGDASIVDLDLPLARMGPVAQELRADRVAFLLTETERVFAARSLSLARGWRSGAVDPAPVVERIRSSQDPQISIVWAGNLARGPFRSLVQAADRELPKGAWEVLVASGSRDHPGRLCVTAAREARGRHLVFVVGAMPLPGTLEALAKATRGGAAALGGPLVEQRSDRILSAGLAFARGGEGRAIVESLFRGRPSGDAEAARRREPALLPLEGLVVSREVVLRHRAALEAASRDVDAGLLLTLELLAAGERCEYEPSLVWGIDRAAAVPARMEAPAREPGPVGQDPSGELQLETHLGSGVSGEPRLAFSSSTAPSPMAALFVATEIGYGAEDAGSQRFPVRSVAVGDAPEPAREAARTLRPALAEPVAET